MKPQATVYIEAVRLTKGEILTVYAYRDEHFREATQIELRVTPDGEIELFCDGTLEARPFSEWELMEKA